jgi:cell division protein FtsB
MELANQIQALRDENARLRGQVETLNYELDAAKKRQQDFYVDLDVACASSRHRSLRRR